MVNEKTEEKQEKPKEKWIVTEVPTQTAPAIVNTETKEIYTVETALAKILNDIEKLKKLL